MSLPFASRPVLVALCAALAVPALGAAALAQASYRFVTVRVTDEGTQAPLPAVRVTVQGVGDREWSTDELGGALLAVARGSRAVLLLRRIGYSPVTTTAAAGSDSTEVRVVMTRAAQTLDTAKVVGEASSAMFAGFDGRRMRGAGSATFITREQIEKQMAIRTIDVVRRAIGTRVIDSSGVLLVASSRGSKAVIGGGAAGVKGGKGGFDLAPCIMRVAVDGMLREWGFSLDWIDPREIHGVEVYPGPATMPPEFSGLRKDAYCGLIMIWTRRGP